MNLDAFPGGAGECRKFMFEWSEEIMRTVCPSVTTERSRDKVLAVIRLAEAQLTLEKDSRDVLPLRAVRDRIPRLMALHIHLPRHFDPEQVCRMVRQLQRCEEEAPTKADLRELEKRIMDKIDELLAEIEGNTTLLQGLDTMFDGMRQQIIDVMTGAQIPPAVQARIVSAIDKVKAQGAKLTEALTENTPLAELANPTPPTGGGNNTGDTGGGNGTGNGETPPTNG